MATKEMGFQSIHSKVLVVGVLNRAEPEAPIDDPHWRGDYAAYVVPVQEGESWEDAAKEYRSRGSKTSEALAHVVLGGLCEGWENRGYKWRK